MTGAAGRTAQGSGSVLFSGLGENLIGGFGQLVGMSGKQHSRPERVELDSSDSFREIFDQQHDVILRYLRRRVRSSVAEDLAAETFLTAFRRYSTFDRSRGSVRAWLFGIAANLMRQEARRERRELRALARTGVDPLTRDPNTESDHRIDASKRSRELALGLAKLKSRDREALLLFCWADLSYDEIGEALQIPVGTVKSRISRSRRKLRSFLSEQNDVNTCSAIPKEAAPNG